MAELIKFEEVATNDFMGVQLCNLLAQLREENIFPGNQPVMNEQNEKCIEVALTINGHPVSFRSTIERMKKCYEWATAKQAEELVKEKLAELDNAICDLTNHVKNVMYDKLGIERE